MLCVPYPKVYVLYSSAVSTIVIVTVPVALGAVAAAVTVTATAAVGCGFAPSPVLVGCAETALFLLHRLALCKDCCFCYSLLAVRFPDLCCLVVQRLCYLCCGTQTTAYTVTAPPRTHVALMGLKMHSTRLSCKREANSRKRLWLMLVADLGVAPSSKQDSLSQDALHVTMPCSCKCWPEQSMCDVLYCSSWVCSSWVNADALLTDHATWALKH